MLFFTQLLKFNGTELTLFFLPSHVWHTKPKQYSLTHFFTFECYYNLYQFITKMNKQIFAVVPISKKMQDGKALYGVQLRLNGLQRTQKVWRSIQQYCNLQKQISQIAFDFQQNVQKQLPKTSTDEQKFKIILQFINQCKFRPDITNLIIFRQFFELAEVQFQYLDQWMRVEVGIKDMAINGLAYDANLDVIIVIYQPKGKAKKVTNFLKQLFSKPVNSGVIRIYKQLQKSEKWKMVYETNLQSSPTHLIWSSKSSLLFISTQIGIFVYTIKKQGQKIALQLIDFVKVFNITSFQYGAKSGRLYYSTNQKIHLHSLNDQFSMQINAQPFHNTNSIQINKAQTRLYCSQDQNLRIYDISNIKDTKQIVCLQQIGNFNKLTTYSDKYLFGICQNGYISVFQIQAAGKQRLTNVLTNIDCPKNMPMFAFNERYQLIISSNGQYIVLISTKNVPLFAGGSHKSPITSGLYDPESNLIITSDEEGYCIFYNLCFKLEY